MALKSLLNYMTHKLVARVHVVPNKWSANRID